jgi:TPR repeat protein
MSKWKMIALGVLALNCVVTLSVLVYSNSAGGRARGCDAGDMLDCANLAARYESGADVKKDERQAFALYEKACEGGLAWACGSLGGFYAEGRTVPIDYVRALPLLHKGCSGGIVTGCDELGKLYRDGRGVPVDLPRAHEAFAAACNANTPHGRNRQASGHEPGCDEARDVASRMSGTPGK